MSESRGLTFERCALISGLLSRDDLDEAWLLLPPSSNHIVRDSALGEEQLAQKLVEIGRINVWQAKQLLDGRTKFTLGAYRIVDSLGQGGMGQVFKGEHSVLARTVAIKVLPLAKSTPVAVASFLQEIRNQAMLDHENLVHALDSGQDGNVYYLVTEYVPGCDLRKLVRRDGLLSMPAAARIISEVAAGLQYAHEQGLIHRDVKPGNVLVTPDGHAKLSDLGLASSLREDASDDPRFGKIMGTADYLSPDHITAPWEPKPAWDIYSLGCTLYYAVTGKVPFPFATTMSDKAKAHCELQPLDPRRLNPALESDFVDVIADMMAKDPTRRIPTASDVVARLAPWTRHVEPVRTKLRDSEIWSQVEIPAPTPDSSSEVELEDTQTSAPRLGPKSPEEKPPGEKPTAEVPSTLPLASPTETSPAEPSVVVWSPLLFLVLLPLGLTGVVMLIWWFVRLLVS